MNIGILGTGSIASIMANTIYELHDPNIVCYGIASRTLSKAQSFKEKHHVTHAYGSYEELVKDDAIDLVYIATPHSAHYQDALLCLQHKKPILCEKPFTINYNQAKHLLQLANDHHVFVAEAIWTRYMPSKTILQDLLAQNVIGNIHSLQANIGYQLQNVERMKNPMLAGGALLDIGIYPIHFAMMVFGEDAKLTSSYAYIKDGVDVMDSITMQWPNGTMAVLHATMMTNTEKDAYIYGEQGYIKVQNINNPEAIYIYSADHQLQNTIQIPQQISGYEYELYACAQALAQNKLECAQAPHALTLHVLQFMDMIRKQWNLSYPME